MPSVENNYSETSKLVSTIVGEEIRIWARYMVTDTGHLALLLTRPRQCDKTGGKATLKLCRSKPSYVAGIVHKPILIRY